jgi:hypothetical protein
MTKPFSGIERRAFGRRETQEHAVVRIAGRPPLRCIVRNISDGGALLDFGQEVWLPFQFRLIWEGTKREETCDIKHQNGPRIGVSFAAHEHKDVDTRVLSVNDIAPWMAEHQTAPRR